MIISNICPHCATEFRTDTLHERCCPHCSYYFTAASRSEDGEVFEDPNYVEVLVNFKRGESYLLTCESCGAKARMYLKEARCHCGELCKLDAEPTPSPTELKAIRKDLGYTQAAMGAALGVSQGFYSQLESGRRSLSDAPMVAKRLLIISANTIIPEA